MFKSKYKPSGDQPQAIDKLVSGIENGKKEQVLLVGYGNWEDIYYCKCNPKSE